ncbi:hypothetical protein KKH27_01870 [bacterium]|nr:hypothetical protein [bacterium]MBU1984953.1 hypothetical protein [bacterium]
MRLKRTWQSGAADLISVAVGMAILSIVVAGTSAAMIYGRDALLREEHAKAAAYLLRGEMEKFQAGLQVVDDARNADYGRSYLNTLETSAPIAIDTRADRGGDHQQVFVTIRRERVRYVDPLVQGSGYIIEAKATWTEPDLAGSRRTGGSQREIKFKTATVVKQEL